MVIKDKGFLGGLDGKESAAMQKTWVRSLGWEGPWKREWQPTPAFWPGEFHGQRRLAGDSQWGHKESESDTTEQLALSIKDRY